MSSQFFFSLAARKVQHEQTTSEFDGLMKRSRLFSPYLPPFLSFGYVSFLRYFNSRCNDIMLNIAYRSIRKSENISIFVKLLLLISDFEYLFFINVTFML